MSSRDRVYPSQPDAPTILVYVSQWKYLNSAFGWQGKRRDRVFGAGDWRL
jgi:hypothetical protein